MSLLQFFSCYRKLSKSSLARLLFPVGKRLRFFDERIILSVHIGSSLSRAYLSTTTVSAFEGSLDDDDDDDDSLK